MNETETFDAESRWLCPDGACTGLLGADGKCKTCGAQGEVPTPYRDAQAPLFNGAPTKAGGDEGAVSGEEPPPSAVTAPPPPIAANGDEEWDDRQLCPDGACTGLIGADGKCKECGRSLSS